MGEKINQIERDLALQECRKKTVRELLDALLHGSCERSTTEQALREKLHDLGCIRRTTSH